MRFRNIWTEAMVVATTDLTSQIRQLELRPMAGMQVFLPGAHLDVSVIVKDKPEIRSYSLLPVNQTDSSYHIAVKRLPDSRGGSEYMHGLTIGTRVQISQPQNHFELTPNRSSYTLIAGGIGITAVYGMALTLMARGADVQLHYCGTSRNDMPFLEKLQVILQDKLHVYASDEQQRLNLEILFDTLPEKAQVYLCGPMRMLEAARRVWQGKGLPQNDLRYETFGASGQFAAEAFRVLVPRFNLDLMVDTHETLLTVLKSAGADVMSDCLRGECGLCTVDVLACDGSIDHRDFFFSDHQKAENKKLCTCVSRVVNGTLTLDTAYRG
jgi:ferredoxin-NADP reductase